MERQPNERLTGWFERTGWSKGELARRVNRGARLKGSQHVSTDTSRVRRWLGGEHPREPIPGILADLFSERFGFPVSVDDLGLAPGRPGAPLDPLDLPWNATDTAEMIGEFARADLGLASRAFAGTALSLSAGPQLVESMRRWLAPDDSGDSPFGPPPAQARRPVVRLTSLELDQLQLMVQVFRRWDEQCGGGLRRRAVVGQLHDVSELLPVAEQSARARLFRITAELAHLAGWMSYDVGLQQQAQKYFVLALHAAWEAGEPDFGAFVLTGMSRQMIHLGRPADALGLLDLAWQGAGHRAPGPVRAMLHAVRARAHATTGHLAAFEEAMRLAEAVFVEPRPDTDPDWISSFTRAELASERAHALRDLALRAERPESLASRALEPMETAVDLCRADETRRRSFALNLVGLTSVQLLGGDLAAAMASADDAIAVAGGVRSERVNLGLRRTATYAAAHYPGRPEIARLSDRVLTDLPEVAVA